MHFLRITGLLWEALPVVGATSGLVRRHQSLAKPESRLLSVGVWQLSLRVQYTQGLFI